MAEQGHGLATDAGDLAALLSGDARHEMPDQKRDIFAAGSEWRNGQRQHMQPVEKVFAELSGLHLIEQVAVGCGDDPHIDLYGLPSADCFDFALLQGAQELYLRGQRQFTDLVEKQRAAIRLKELAGMTFGRAGERTLLMTEQNRLHEIVGNRAAIDGDEWFGAALGRAMNGAGDQLLADAGFAFDQHRNRGPGRLLAYGDDVIHRLRTGDDVGKGELAFAAMSDALQLAFQSAGIERVAQRDLQALDTDRLHDEIVRTGAHC